MIKTLPGILQPPPLKINDTLYGARGGTLPPTCRLEQRLVWNMMHHLELNGWSVVGVWDSEEFTVTANPLEAMEIIFNLDECSVRFAKTDNLNRAAHETTREEEGNRWADNEEGVMLVFGNNGTDAISDWTFVTSVGAVADDFDFGHIMDAFEPDEYA